MQQENTEDQLENGRRIAVALGIVLPGLVLAAIFGLRYAAWALPTIGFNDDGALQVMGWQLGLAYGNGYSLYIWIAKLATCIFPGTEAHRITLLSAAAASAALMLFYLLAGSHSRGSRWSRWSAALIATALLALSPTFRGIAEIPAAYTLQIALILGIFLLLYHWSVTRRQSCLWISAVLTGMAAVNHPTGIALIPAYSVFIVLHGGTWRARVNTLVRAGLIVAAVGVFCDVVLFWLLWRRHLPFDHWNGIIVASRDLFGLSAEQCRSFWSAWWFMMNAGQFAGEFFNPRPGWFAEQLKLFPWRLAIELGISGGIAAAAGFVLLWRQWRFTLLLALVLVTQVVLAASYSATSKTQIYVMIPTAIALLCTAAGLTWAFDILGRWCGLPPPARRTRNGTVLRHAILFVLVVVAGTAICLGVRKDRARIAAYLQTKPPAYAAVGSLATMPHTRGTTQALDAARFRLANIPDHALVFTSWFDLNALYYVALTERPGSGLEFREATPYCRNPGAFSLCYLEEIRSSIDRRPIFFFVPPPEVRPEGVDYAPAGPNLWRAQRAAETSTTPPPKEVTSEPRAR